MKFTTALLAIASISSQTSAFSPVCSNAGKIARSHGFAQNFQPTIMYSTEGEEEKVPTPQTDALSQKSVSFTNEPKAPERIDPLIQSLTRNDVDNSNKKMTNLPLLGEVPVDGSLVVLVPVAIIAIVGFIMSIQIGFQSKDAIMQQLDEINNTMSQPPVKMNVVPTSGCRGLCSDQGEQLDTMKTFMEGLSKKKSAMLDEM